MKIQVMAEFKPTPEQLGELLWEADNNEMAQIIKAFINCAFNTYGGESSSSDITVQAADVFDMKHNYHSKEIQAMNNIADMIKSM